MDEENKSDEKISEMLFTLFEVYTQKERMDGMIKAIEGMLAVRGYSVRTTDKKISVVFVGTNSLLCPDGKIRKERPKMRRSIEKLMEKEKISIDIAILYIKHHGKKFSKGYLTQAQKMKFEHLSKKEISIDISKYKENAEIA